MTAEKWCPDYTQEIRRRLSRLERIKADHALMYGARLYYKDNPAAFINDWCMTYDPRKASSDSPARMPFILFERQKDLIHFLSSCIKDQESGLIEKCRDAGATWICTAFSVHQWIFNEGSSIGWGSRKELLVDRLGDPDSIFEKIRMQIAALPFFLKPEGFDPLLHSSYMKLINPETGSTITGEAGDNIGRGGRKSIYFKDESAYYEHPEKIEAALGDNTNVQIDISSVNGNGNVFFRRRHSGTVWNKDRSIAKGQTRIFIFDWRDHPLKTVEWYKTRREKAEREGLLHVFAREVDRDYSASVENLFIKKEWIQAAIDAHRVLNIPVEGQMIASLDVADEGGDKNALAIRKGIVLIDVDQWAEGDTGDSARKALILMKHHGCKCLQYDSVGVGSGVKTETNRQKTEGIIDSSFEIVGWNAGKTPLFPNNRIIEGDKDTPKNIDFFANLKAQAYWNLRIRFEKTFKAVIRGQQFKEEELISIDSGCKFLSELIDELAQPTFYPDGKGKIAVNKKPEGTKSPNIADAIKTAFFPIRKARVLI